MILVQYVYVKNVVNIYLNKKDHLFQCVVFISVIIDKVQASVSRNRNRSSVTITIDPDPIKKEYIELLESTSSEGLIDDAAAIESKRRAIDEIIDIFDYYPRSVAATSSPEAVVKAKNQKIRK